MKNLLIATALVLTAFVLISEFPMTQNNVKDEFKNYMKKFGKKYSDDV
jgi:hypothetical protein